MSYIVTASTSVVLVDTNTGTPPYTVLLPPISTIGRLITVRDNAGYASTGNSIVVSTTNGALFQDGTNTLQINQPFGFVTLSIQTLGTYALLNTFAFPAGSAAAYVQQLTTSTLLLQDTSSSNLYPVYSSNATLYYGSTPVSQVTEAILQSTVNGLGSLGYLSSLTTIIPSLFVTTGLTSSIVQSATNNPLGTIQWSQDGGVTWQAASNSPTTGFNKGGADIAYYNGLYVACGNNHDDLTFTNTGHIQWSMDGKSWYNSYTSLPYDNYRNRVQFNNGLWHCVGNAPSDAYYSILWSIDGKTWNPANNNGANPFTGVGGQPIGIAFGNGVWVVSGNTVGSSLNSILWSIDGSNWNPAATVSWSQPSAADILFNGTQFIALVAGGINASASNLAKSTDGSNWTSSGLSGGNLNLFPTVQGYFGIQSNLSTLQVTPNMLMTAYPGPTVGPGQILKQSYNGGLAWASNINVFSVYRVTRPFYDGNKWWTGFQTSPPISQQGIYYSLNDGTTWQNTGISGGFPGGYPQGFTLVPSSSNINVQLQSTVIGLETNFFTSSLQANFISAGSISVSSLFVVVQVISTTFETVTNVSTLNVNLISSGSLVTNSISVNTIDANTIRTNLLSANTISTNTITMNSNVRIADAAGSRIGIGYQAGFKTQGQAAIAIGYQAGTSNQQASAIALGATAGYSNQGVYAVGIGIGAGYSNQNTNAVAIGRDAGFTNQASDCIAIGAASGGDEQDQNAVAIGAGAGQFSQSTNCVAIGYTAGNANQGSGSIAIGFQSGNIAQYNESIAIGFAAGFTNQGTYSLALGSLAGYTNQGTNCVAIGRTAGQTNQASSAVAIGNTAGYTGQSISSIAIGPAAGYTGQSTNAIAIGFQAGFSNQGESAVAIGMFAGNSGQLGNTVAVGQNTGYFNQGRNAVALGNGSGYSNQSTFAIAIGNSAGFTNQGVEGIGIGRNAGYSNQGSDSIAIGSASGFSAQDQNAVAIGAGAGQFSQSSNCVALGYTAGNANQGNGSIAIGFQSGNSGQGLESIAIGYAAAISSQGLRCVAVGDLAGYASQNNNAVAIGFAAGQNNQSTFSIAIGYQAGSNLQGSNCIALGYNAGMTNQSNNAIAIGYGAGNTNQHSNTIMLNATGANLNSVQGNSFYVNPVRNATPVENTNYPVSYNPTTAEITYNTAVSISQILGLQTSNYASTLTNGNAGTSSITLNYVKMGYFIALWFQLPGIASGNQFWTVPFPFTMADTLYSVTGATLGNYVANFASASNATTTTVNCYVTSFDYSYTIIGRTAT